MALHNDPPLLPESDRELVALAVGNTRARVGLFRGREFIRSTTIDAYDPSAVAIAVRELCDAATHDLPVIVSSVNPAASDAIEQVLIEDPGFPHAMMRFGPTFPIPIQKALTDTQTVGQDRLLCALAAFARTEQACVVVDAGTAVTCDFVDGEGTFQGGAIAPGARMMLAALRSGTASLPDVPFSGFESGLPTFGKDTPSAIQLGVHASIRGMVRLLVEQYATAQGGYPIVIATGGDAQALFADEPLIERIEPELQLIGIQAAAERHAKQLASDEDDDDLG